jgi:hypothetical protein
VHRKTEVLSASIITFQNTQLNTLAAPTGGSQLVNQGDVCAKQNDPILTTDCWQPTEQYFFPDVL